jgi:protein-L-isoaspartate(D-aspartate) O-methyltransferase
MARVPRHELVPRGAREIAYEDGPLPIGEGQTISQPYIVAAMSEAARSRATSACSRSARARAIRPRCSRRSRARSTRSSSSLARARARTRARAARLHERAHAHGDGYRGWPEAAPFDAIVVTAAPDHVPPRCSSSSRSGGRLVIPVGLAAIRSCASTRRPRAASSAALLLPVRFVPLRSHPDD